MGSLSIWHWLIVAIVAGILFFGWKQLPDMARSVGRSMRIFKTEIKGMSEDDKKREEAHAAENTAPTVAEPPALEPRRAQVVKNDVPTVSGAVQQPARPRRLRARGPAAPPAPPVRSNRRPFRSVRAGAICAAAFVVLVTSGAAGVAPAEAAPLPQDCKAQQGGALNAVPWAQTRLNFQQVWPITEGRSVADGKPVVVAVIDSGMDTRHPQLRGIDSPTAYDVIDPAIATDRTDCVGHGTGVVSIIAAQPDPAHPQFVGVAPQVQIVPIKQTNAADGSQDAIVRGIDQAVAVHAQVANISIGVTNAQPPLLAAVRRAAAAGMVIVASAGNDGQSTNLPEYPAAYAPQEPNVIAVSASDQSDGVPNFSVRGNYVTVAAPGQGVTVAGQVSGFFPDVSGTSFATPFVTGTVALMIAAHPGITPQQIRDRIESTADTPPADSLPDPRYGWGILNPYLAVTDVHTGPQPSTARATATPLPARAVPPPPDRSLEHLAIGVTLGLIGLAIVLAAGAAVFRGRRRPAMG